MTEEKNKKEEVKAQPKTKEVTYVMKVSRLDYGANNKNHFYADEKPLINAKKMGKYASVLKIWLDKNWIEKGEYKKPKAKK